MAINAVKKIHDGDGRTIPEGAIATDAISQNKIQASAVAITKMKYANFVGTFQSTTSCIVTITSGAKCVGLWVAGGVGFSVANVAVSVGYNGTSMILTTGDMGTATMDVHGVVVNP
jgi:hypothetical protein